jgi:4-amino-4-deoxy-L-arabinose transferase-like glycosyltransferase
VVTGVSEWGARGFASLAGIALVLLTYRIGRRLLGRADDAWLGAAIVATCYGYFALARLALPDLPLALFTTLAVFLWLEHRFVLTGVAVALGFLDKGPLAVVVPGLILLAIAAREWWFAGRDGTRPQPVSLSVKALLGSAAAFVVVAAPWYLAMVAEHGTPYLRSFFIGDNLERFATDRFNSPRGIWFYVPIVIGGIFPWTGYLVVLPWRRTIDLLKRRAGLTTNEWRLLVWTLAPLAFFTASVGKQPRYILPVLPPLALLLGASIARRIRNSRRGDSTASRGLAFGTWLTASIYFVLAALLYQAQPMLINAYPLLTFAGVTSLVVSGVALVWTAAREEWVALPLRMALSAVAFLLTVQFGALAGARPEAVEVIAELVRSNRSNAEAVGVYATLQRNLVFYTGVRQVELFDDRQAIEFLKSPERVLLVARARDVERLQSLSDVSLHAIGSVDYLDPASIRLSTLLSPLPQQDVQDVLLVANR